MSSASWVVETGTISDMTNLYDESFSIGARNSGTEGSGRFILGKVGIDLEQVDIAYLGYGPSADAMQNGNIDGMNIPAGVPASAVTRAYANLGGEITTLDFTEAQLAEVNSDFELWTPYLIPAGTYPNQDKDINTIAQPNICLLYNTDADDNHTNVETEGRHRRQQNTTKK